jgi:hypothetical protein
LQVRELEGIGIIAGARKAGSSFCPIDTLLKGTHLLELSVADTLHVSPECIRVLQQMDSITRSLFHVTVLHDQVHVSVEKGVFRG